jgi:hypothetical protein
MLLLDVTCAACPAFLRLLVATKVTDEGAPTSDVDMGDLLKKFADFKWSFTGPLCPACAAKMRRTTN